MHYIIKFSDGVTYTSPDIRRKDPGWATEYGAKKEGIREMVLRMPKWGKEIRLTGYEAYNFFVEASQSMSGGGARIEAFCVCGKSRGKAVVYRVMPEGAMTSWEAPDGQEYGGAATRGWRKGLIGERSRSGVCHLQ